MSARGAPPQDADSLLWPAVRATPLVLEPSRGRTGSLPVTPSRAGGQTLLVALMVLAFLVLVIARTTAPSGQAPSPPAGVPGGVAASGAAIGTAASPGPSATPAPSAPSASPAPSPATAAPTASPAPTSTSTSTPAPSNAAPSPTAVPSHAQRYTVRSGDTLGSIAARFGTTVGAIAKANGITNPRLIRVGQVLIIP